jgi:streptogramin lyase
MRRILSACLLVFALLVEPVLAAQAELAVVELQLNPTGNAVDIHADYLERLWISDTSSGEIWRVTANGGLVQVYQFEEQNPRDVTPDANGNVWWVDEDKIYRMNADSGSYTNWEVTDGSALNSLEVDYRGNVWVNDASKGILYRFDPQNYNQLCSYPLETGKQGYITAWANSIWVGDSPVGGDARILRLDPEDEQLTWWFLPSGHSPYQLAPDGSGAIWYTNPQSGVGFGGLGRLKPSANEVEEFLLPVGVGTKMLVVTHGKIWYSGQNQSSFGQVDPDQARATSSEPVYSAGTILIPSCSNPFSSGGGYAEMPSGNHYSWGQASTSSLMDSDGWKIYRLPDPGQPAGITMTTMGWLVDSGRQVLARFNAGIPPLGHLKTYIPLMQR